MRRRGWMPLAALALLAACSSLIDDPDRVLASGAQWEEVSRVGLSSSEGVVSSSDGSVYVVDLTAGEAFKDNNPGGTVYRYSPFTREIAKVMEPSGMAFGLHIDRRGDLIIAQGAEPAGGRAIVRRNLRSGATTVLADSYQGKRLVSPNDVTSDAAGRIYFSDARYFGREPMELPNAVYRIDPDGTLVQLATDILRPNGIEVSPDSKRLYVAACNVAVLPKNPSGPAADRFGFTGGGIAVYDLDARGNVAFGRVFYRHPDLPCIDGMAVDRDGNVYAAAHNGRQQPARSEVVVIDRSGRVFQKLAAPEGMRITNLGFGRGRDAGWLYATTLIEWRLYRIRTVRHGLYWD